MTKSTTPTGSPPPAQPLPTPVVAGSIPENPTTPAAEKPALTAEQVTGMLTTAKSSDFLKSIISDKPPVDPDAIAPVTPPAPVAPPTETPPPAATPEAKPSVKVARGYNKGNLTEREIADIAARAAATATAKPAAPEPPKADPLADLSEGEREHIEVMKELEKLYPKQPEYRGISERAVAAAREMSAVAKQMEARLAAAKDDDEHEAIEAEWDKANVKIEAKHNVNYDDRHYAKAVARMETEPLRADNRRLQKQIEERAAQEQMQQAVPQIAASALASAKESAVAIAGDDAKDLFDASGQISQEKLAAMFDKNPIAAAHIPEMVRDAQNIATGVELVMRGIESKNTHLINTVAQDISELEAKLVSEGNTTDSQGRKLAGYAAYMSASPEARAGYWAVTPQMVIAHARSKYEAGVKARIAELSKFRKPSNGAPAPAAATAPKPAALPSAGPSMNAQPVVPGPAQGGKSPAGKQIFGFGF